MHGGKFYRVRHREADFVLNRSHTLYNAIHGVSSRDTSKIPIDKNARLCFLEITGERDRAVVWLIIFRMEGADIVDGRLIEMLHRTDGRPMVAACREEMPRNIFPHGAIRTVLVSLAALLFHDIALIFEILAGHLERKHPVAFAPEHKFELAR